MGLLLLLAGAAFFVLGLETFALVLLARLATLLVLLEADVLALVGLEAGIAVLLAALLSLLTLLTLLLGIAILLVLAALLFLLLAAGAGVLVPGLVVHVAAYVAHKRFHVAERGGIAGAVLQSGIYDTLNTHPNDFHRAYYGDERAMWGPASMQAGLVNSEIPLLFTVSELDPADFQIAAARIVAEWSAAKSEFAPVQRLLGHNHISPALSLGSSVTDVEELVAEFVNRVTG